MADNVQNEIAMRQAKNADFLRNSYKRKMKMNSVTPNNYAAGTQITFNAPVVPGWASKIRVFYDLTVTVSLGTGTAVKNAAAPYNLFSNVSLSFAGQTHRSHSGYFLKVLQQSYRGLLDIADSASWADAIIGDGGITLPLEEGVNVWKGYFDILLQIEENNTAGLVPLGDSATPLSLSLTAPASFTGSDPFTNVVALTGNAAVTVEGTVSAYVEYRYGQSVHSPAIVPSRPFIGSFAKVTEQVVAVSQNSDYSIIQHRNPYPYLKICHVPVIPTATAKFCDMTKLSAFRYMLDPSTCMYDYSPAGAGIGGLVADQRILYHADLDEGVILLDFLAGSNPEVPNGINTPNVGNYNASESQVLYSGPLASSNNRIITMEMYLESLPY